MTQLPSSEKLPVLWFLTPLTSNDKLNEDLMSSSVRNNWEAFIIDTTKDDWGEYQSLLKSGGLNGAIIVGIDDRSWKKQDLAHKIISLMQKISMLLKREKNRNLFIRDLSSASHVYILNKPLSLTEEEVQSLKKAQKEKKARKKEIKEQLGKRITPWKRMQLNQERSSLKEEVSRLQRYIFSNNVTKSQGDGLKSILVSESAAQGLMYDEEQILNKNDYTKLLVLLPPEKIAAQVDALSRAAVTPEIDILAGKRKRPQVPFNWKGGALLPLLDSTRSSVKTRDSTARAIVDLIKERPIHRKNQKEKSMVCSEFAIRILQAAYVCEELGDENIEKIKKMSDKEAVEMIKKIPIRLHPLMHMRAAGTMPYHVVDFASQVTQKEGKESPPVV
jgi:hypothetical protein